MEPKSDPVLKHENTLSLGQSRMAIASFVDEFRTYEGSRVNFSLGGEDITGTLLRVLEGPGSAWLKVEIERRNMQSDKLGETLVNISEIHEFTKAQEQN